MIHAGDCLEVLRELDADSIDAVITDPPYLLEFMGAEWDRPGDVRQPDDPTFHRSGAGPFDRAKVRHGGYEVTPVGPRMQEWHAAWAREAFRVLKPGGYVAAFGGSRTSHRLASAIEDAGFEIRDSIVWLYASGFPKSLDVSKAIDKAAGAEREVVGVSSVTGARSGSVIDDEKGYTPGRTFQNDEPVINHRTAPATPDAEQWDGWGTALKPAHEPVVVARKPLAGTVAANVLEHGTGAINIAAGRIVTSDNLNGGAYAESSVGQGEGLWRGTRKPDTQAMRNAGLAGQYEQPVGRWPANVALSHSEGCERVGTRRVKAITGTASGRMGEDYQSSVYGGYTGNSELFGKPTGYGDEDGMEVVDEWNCIEGCPVRALDEQSGLLESGTGAVKRASAAGYESGSMAGRESRPEGTPNIEYGDAGGASRFFFCAKASRGERNAGLDAFEKKPILWSSGEQNPGSFQADGTDRSARNPHPTVKPIDLMRWLVRMFVRPGGVVLDPFAGSGTTGCAAALEGMGFIGIEREPEYVRIAEARIAYWSRMPVGMDTKRVLRAELANREHDGQLTLL